MLLPRGLSVYMASEPVDLRRGHDGLIALVRMQFEADPYEGHLFVFLGRRRDRCKILYWDRGGFVLYYKRLERGRFRVPERSGDTGAIELDTTALMMLLDGIDVRTVRRPRLWEPSVRKIA